MKPAWENSVGLFAGVLVYYAIAYVFGLAKAFPSDLPYPFLQGAALVAAIYWSSFSAVGLWRRYASWRDSWKPCEHGLRGGRMRRRCRRCVEFDAIAEAEAQATREAAEHTRAKLLRREESETRARELAKQESARLFGLYVPKLEELRGLSPQKFEDMIAAMFQRLGYDVEQTPYSNDYGRDAIMIRNGKKVLLECKRYGPDVSSDREQLQKFHSAMVTDKADAGFFVTTGRVTNGAIEFAKRVSIEIVSAGAILDIYFESLGDAAEDVTYQSLCIECGNTVTHSLRSQSPVLCSNGHSVAPTIKFDDVVAAIPSPGIRAPKCPKCSAVMRLVQGKRGPFWGCSRWPACNSTLAYQGSRRRRARISRRSWRESRQEIPKNKI
jgi:hypothetical protein